MSRSVRAPWILTLALALGVLLSGCTARVTVATAIGGGIGVASGAALGEGTGALIGAGVGLAVGLVVGTILELSHQFGLDSDQPRCGDGTCPTAGLVTHEAQPPEDPRQGERLALTEALGRAVGVCGAHDPTTTEVTAAVVVQPSGAIERVALRREHPAAFVACVTKELSALVLSADRDRPGQPIEATVTFPDRAP